MRKEGLAQAREPLAGYWSFYSELSLSLSLSLVAGASPGYLSNAATKNIVKCEQDEVTTKELSYAFTRFN